MGGAELICPAYDPITSSCAPSCCVCSQIKNCKNRAALEDEAFKFIMELDPEERDELLTRWEKRIASRNTADQSTLQEAI